MKSLSALACALLLVACGGPSGKADQPVVKRAVQPSWVSASAPFVAPGWKSGDKASWQEQLTKRAQNQNEYPRTN